MNGLLLLDLDGTVRNTISGDTFIGTNPYDQKLIKGVLEVAKYYSDKGWFLVGITNQGGVEKGYKSLENCIEEQRYTLELLPYLDQVYFCPNFKGNICYRVKKGENDCFKIYNTWASDTHSFRKPGIGMVAQILLDYKIGEQNIPIWMVGDSDKDRECALNAHINFVWDTVWRTRNQKGLVEVNLSNKKMGLDDLKKFLLT